MTADEVQVVRIHPRVGAYWISNNACNDELRTSDWTVGFFKTLGVAAQKWKDATAHRFAAATFWRLRPKEETEQAVIDELKRQAAQCKYYRLEVFAIIPPKIPVI